jgi:hypothetical protein
MFSSVFCLGEETCFKGLDVGNVLLAELLTGVLYVTSRGLCNVIVAVQVWLELSIVCDSPLPSTSLACEDCHAPPPFGS